MRVEPVLICPLEVEARWLRRAAPDLPRAVVVGPGDAVRHWIASHAHPRMFPILCGLAGALGNAAPIGSAWVVGHVLAPGSGEGETESRSAPAWPTRSGRPNVGAVSLQATALTVSGTVTSPAARRRLAERHPTATLIDCESWWFAQACERAGVPWLIVRGVSDGPGDTLPGGIDGWVTADGRSRVGAVMRSLLSRPGDVRSVLRLARRGRAAMSSAGRVLQTLWPELNGVGQ